MNIEPLHSVVNKLRATPLFYLFLSSRELFHTNFWFWLSTLNQKETLEILTGSDYAGHNRMHFEREPNQQFGRHKSKIDLLISLDDNKKVVIENKVKDFPTTEQISRIENSFQNEDCDFYLITLFYSQEIDFPNWKVTTYKELSERIIPEAFSEQPYHQELIADYKHFTQSLAELTALLPLTTSYDFAIAFQLPLFYILNDIKLWEGYQKLRASHLVNRFDNIHQVSTHYAINNKKATIQFEKELQNGYSIGIQIENNQFRKFVLGHNAKEFAENLIKENMFLKEEFAGRGGKRFLNYGSHFKYQYEIMETTTFDKLFERINSEFQFITDNEGAINAQIP